MTTHHSTAMTPPEEPTNHELVRDLDDATHLCQRATLMVRVFVREALRSGHALSSQQVQRLLEADERLDHVVRMLRRNDPNAQ